VTFEPIAKEESAAPADPSRRQQPKRKRKAIEISDDEETNDARLEGPSIAGVDAEASTLQDEDSVLASHVKEEPQDDDEVFLAPGSRSSKPLFLPPDNEDEDEDQKPEGKPKLRVSYTGFSIFGKTLVVIVEPYPALDNSRASVAPSDRELSVDPRGREASVAGSEFDGRGRSRSMSTMAPLRSAADPLFRPDTPFEEQDDGDTEADLERFRLRSQSVFSLADPQGSEETGDADLPQ